MKIDQRTARKIILDVLERQGFTLHARRAEILLRGVDAKQQIRSLHSIARREKQRSEIRFLESKLKELTRFFANGDELNLMKFSPQLVQVKAETEFSNLFRLSTLLWSVPVSQGFGRRVRFLILDESNGKLVGLFAVGDPVFNLQIRDQLIGWDHRQRAKTLYHVMDIFVLGAVPPYSHLLCGKLVAMLAASNELRKAVYAKYLGSRTYIRKETKEPTLVLLTTQSALGRSSIYNRIKFGNLLLYRHIGETQGWGHFHIADGTFGMIRQYLSQIGHPIVGRNRFGQGPNWKLRVIRTCLEELGLSPDLLRHGVRREVYAIPLAHNYRDVLLGKTNQPNFYDLPMDSLVEYFKERWFLPRAARVQKYKTVARDDTLAKLNEICEG